MSIARWMSWEGGVDLVACTRPGLEMPNVIVHVGRIVHTPAGSAASGLVLFAPDLAKGPEVMGFVSADPKVGAFFGPEIFAGTPFEKAPVLAAKIEVSLALPDSVSATVTVGGRVFKTKLSGLKPAELINRPAGALPFAQQGLEQAASKAELWVDGKEVPVIVPPVGISGGPAAVYAACGVYAR